MNSLSHITCTMCALLLAACNSHDGGPPVTASVAAPVAAAAPVNPLQENPMLAHEPRAVVADGKGAPAVATAGPGANVPAAQNDPFKAFLDNQKKK